MTAPAPDSRRRAAAEAAAAPAGRTEREARGVREDRAVIRPLTSLRFVFALMVFAAHCYVVDGVFDAHLFKEGFVGVSFFFVLSGFVISYNYRDRLLTGATTRRAFYVARFARVYPLHWLTLLVAVLLGYGATADAGEWWRHFLASLTLTNAYVPRADYFFSFNSPSWSLCCEQLFYLCFPLLVPLARDARRLAALVAVAALLLVAGMSLTPEEAIKGYWYVNPLARFPDFVVGMLLFALYERLRERPIDAAQGTLLECGSVALFLLFYLAAAGVPKVYRYSCYYWLPVAAVTLCFALQRGALSRLLSHRLAVAAGEISYGFYLIHLFLLLGYAQWQAAAGWQVPWYLSVPLLLAVSVALSALSRRWFERPANRWIKSLLNE